MALKGDWAFMVHNLLFELETFLTFNFSFGKRNLQKMTYFEVFDIS